MMPIPWFQQPATWRRQDLASRELRAYVEHELRGDESLVYAMPRVKFRGLRWRFRRWLRRTTARGAATSVASSPFPSAPAWSVLSRSAALLPLSSQAALAGPCTVGGPGIPCSHPVQEDLGGGSGVSYDLCLSCGAVLVVTVRGRWVLPPVDSRDPREIADVVAPPFSKYP